MPSPAASILVLSVLAGLPEDSSPARGTACPAGLARLSAVIVNGAGEPAADERVWVRDPRLPWWSDFYPIGEDGSFESACYPRRTHEIAVRSKEGFLAWTAIEPGAPRRFELSPGVRLAGVLLDSEGHASKGRVYLNVADEETRRRWGQPDGEQAKADDAGAFKFLGVPPGSYELSADLRAGEAVLQAEPVVVAVAEGDARAVVLRPEAGLRLSGRVVDEKGRPVAGAEVSAKSETAVRLMESFAPGRPAGARASAVLTGENGEFVLDWLTREPWRIHASHEGFADSAVQTASPPAQDLALALPAAAILAGRVIGPDGKPLPAFSIDGKSYESADGRFSVPLSQLGSDLFFFEAPGHLRRSVKVEAEAGKATSLEVVLPVALPLKGRVLDWKGAPVKEAHVGWLSADGSSSRSATTDARGAFRLEHDGEGTVSVADYRCGAVTRTVTAGTKTMSLVCPKPGALVGRVVDAKGRPVRGTVIRARALDRDSQHHFADGNAKGEYRLDDLPPGFYDIRLQEPDVGAPMAEATVEPGKKIRHDFRLPELGARLEVEIASGRHPLGSEALLRPGRHPAPTSWSELAQFDKESQSAALDRGARAWSFPVSPGTYTLLVFAAPFEQRFFAPCLVPLLVHAQVVEVKGETRVAIDFPDEAVRIERVEK